MEIVMKVNNSISLGLTVKEINDLAELLVYI